MKPNRVLAPRVVGAIAVVVALAALLAVFSPPRLPWNRVLHVQVQATAFGVINPGAWVEVGGAKIGTVSGVDSRNGYALIRLQIQQEYADRLHADAQAIIQPHGLLGPKYVVLQPGSLGQLADGSTISLSRSHVGTDFDQVLNTLQPDVRQNLKVFFVELGRAAKGRGADMNAAFKALGDAALNFTTVTNTLRGRDQDLADFISYSEEFNRDVQNAPISAQIADTDAVLSGLVQVDSSIGGSFDNTAAVAQELTAIMQGNSRNLAAVLQTAPGTIARLTAFLNSAQALTKSITPSLPYLLTAVMEAESAFSQSDANGHYVNIELIGNDCSNQHLPYCSVVPGISTTPPIPAAPTAAAPASGSNPPVKSLSDQQLLQLIMNT